MSLDLTRLSTTGAGRRKKNSHAAGSGTFRYSCVTTNKVSRDGDQKRDWRGSGMAR